MDSDFGVLRKTRVILMEYLPDNMIWEIMSRVENLRDKDSFSLTCKHFFGIDNDQRKSLRIGLSLNPANEVLCLLCTRFKNLERVEISYFGWSFPHGNQLDDNGLLVLSNCCPNLDELSLSHCTSITCAGFTHSGSFSNLSSLKLSFISGVKDNGIASVVARCKKFRLLHLIECSNVEKLSYLENHEKMEDLVIINCHSISEPDIIRLGKSWRSLKRLHLEVPYIDRYMKTMDLEDTSWKQQLITCDSLEELIMTNCVIYPGRGGMACVVEKCKKLRSVNLNMCVGVSDDNLFRLSLESSNLQTFYISVPSQFTDPPHNNSYDNIYSTTRVTNRSLKAIAENCPRLERLSMSSDVYCPHFSPFNLSGIFPIIRTCPLRELTLDQIYLVDDIGMETICSSSQYLERLMIIGCPKITDIGMQFLSRLPRLRVLRIYMCMEITVDGFNTLIGSNKLEELTVFNCPSVSARRVFEGGIAKTIHFG